MGSLDDVLRDSWYSIAFRAAQVTGAVQLVDAHETVLACKAAVYIGAIREDDAGALKGKHNKVAIDATSLFPLLKLADDSALLPERVLDSIAVQIQYTLTVDDILLFTADLVPGKFGLAVLSPVDVAAEDTYIVSQFTEIQKPADIHAFRRLNNFPFKPASETLHLIQDKDYKCEVRPTKSGGVAIMIHSPEASMYHACMCYSDKSYPVFKSIMSYEAEYVPDAWDTKTRVFKKFIKKGINMLQDIELSKKPKLTFNRSTAKPAYEPEDIPPAVEELPDTEETLKDVSMPIDAPPPRVVEDAANEAASAAQVEVSHELEETKDKQPKAVEKRKRQNKPVVKIGFNFAAVTEYLSSQVPELSATEMDQALEEIRDLRELQMAAARRTANIVTAIHKVSKDAIEKIATLQTMFK